MTRLGSGGSNRRTTGVPARTTGVPARPTGGGGRQPALASRSPLATTKDGGGRTALAYAPTPDAVVELQRTAGNRAALSLLAGDASPPPSTATVTDADQLADPTLRFGSRGAAVTRLQDQLVQAGAGLAVDGIFGPVTNAAVRAFQRDGGLVADGIVGKRTWAALRSGNVTIASPSPPGTFTQASLADKVTARLTGLAGTLRHLVPSTAGSGNGATATGSGQGGQGGQGAHGGQVFASFASAGAAFAPAGLGGSTFAPQSADASQADNSQADSSQADGGGLGAMATAAADVIGLVAQPGIAQALGNATDQLTTVVGPLTAGTTDMPLDQVLVQLNTVTANVGQAVANQAGGATGSGSTTVGVVKQSPYKITGDTIADVGQQLDVHMSIHGEAAHVAELQPDMSKPPDSKENQPGPTMFIEPDTNGRVASARVVLNLELVLPEWTKASSTKCACWKKEWDRFHAAISAHEQEHVNRAVNAFSGLHLVVKGMKQDAAWKKFDEVADAYNKAQDDFDTNTDHGKKPAPGTNFNAGTPCSC